MKSNKNITAVFKKIYTLTTSVDPAGGGSISVDPVGGGSTSPSSGTYDAGSTVKLTATPASGYLFDHWEGDASGNVATVTITMDDNKSVTAIFKPTP
jgi:uncharacterized repeat protein (TIGR02543 family)